MYDDVTIDVEAPMTEHLTSGGALAVPASWVRGGTSKCWIFRAEDLDGLDVTRDEFLIRAFGSPDGRQVDGIGGATSTTSKAIVVETGAPEDPVGTVSYSFAQVSVDSPRVEWTSNCGNCATALALHAVQRGLVPLADGSTTFRMRNVGTGLVLQATVPTPDGQAPTDGAEIVRGVPFPGVPVDLGFTADSWSTHGTLFPSGQPMDALVVDGVTHRATLIDAGAPVAVVEAAAIGLTGADPLTDVAARMPFFTVLRRAAARAMGLPDDDQSVPKVGVVGPGSDGIELHARMISMTAPHPAIGLTSAVALAAAADQPGTVVHHLAPARPVYSIGTASGAVRMRLAGSHEGRSVSFRRNARRLADSLVYVPAAVVTDPTPTSRRAVTTAA